MIHNTVIENYTGSTEKLVEEIGNLRYDALAEFLERLSEKIKSDGKKDEVRKRHQLAAALFKCSQKLDESKMAIDVAWKISEPYMR